MKTLPWLRLAAACLALAVLSGCAGTDVVRGRLKFDIRPEEARKPVFWPSLPDTPRYLYVGELLGEPNFEDVSDKTFNPLVSTLKWVVGLFEQQTPMLLQRPHHGAMDAKGRLYVVDAGRNSVVVFDPKAPEEEKSDKGEGQLVEWLYIDHRTPFAGPVAAAIVWDQRIAVSDARLGFVVLFNDQGETVGKIGMGQLQRPTGMAFDRARGLLLVVDTLANQVKVFDREGKLVNTFGGPGEGPGEFNAPTHVAVAGGDIYVSDTLNNRIQIFDGDGRYKRHFGQNGGYVGNLPRPKGVAVGDNGIVYVVESLFNYLLTFNDQGQFLMGMEGSGLKGGNFLLPSGVWTDDQGRIYLADMFNGRVVVFQFLGGDGS